jgi:tripartite-type tricarboxylate transporter receptor subunit TctC
MKSLLKSLLCTVVLAAASSAIAAAPAYPTRPVRIIVYVAPGSLVDVTARLVAEKMAENLHQPVIVENMAGASGLVGIRYVKNQPADGYTLLAATNTVALAPVLNAEPGYELKDFTAIGAMNKASLVMVGTPNQPAKTLAEFIVQAKAKPDSMSFASGGVGTSTFLAASMFLNQTGIKLLHVPYKGTAAAMPDVIGGRVNMMFDAESSTGPQIRDGRLRAFGISGAARSKGMPDVPTLAEQGVSGYNFVIYDGLAVRAGTPKEIVQRLSEALKAALANEAVRERMRKDGSEAWSTSPEEFNEWLRQDSQRIAKVATEMNLEKQ